MKFGLCLASAMALVLNSCGIKPIESETSIIGEKEKEAYSTHLKLMSELKNDFVQKLESSTKGKEIISEAKSKGLGHVEVVAVDWRASSSVRAHTYKVWFQKSRVGPLSLVPVPDEIEQDSDLDPLYGIDQKKDLDSPDKIFEQKDSEPDSQLNDSGGVASLPVHVTFDRKITKKTDLTEAVITSVEKEDIQEVFYALR